MDTLIVEPFVFDLARRQLTKDDKLIALTSKEYELALHLFRHPGLVSTRKHLLEAVWDTRADIHTRTVDAHVSRLRHKLDLSSTHWEISSIYKHGYCLRKVESSERALEVAETELNS